MPTAKWVIDTRLKGVRGHVAVAVWCREDVIEKAREKGIQLGERSADEILDHLDHKQDCTEGISWITLDVFIDFWKEEHPHYRRYHPDADEFEETQDFHGG
jgi:hypothetical protein